MDITTWRCGPAPRSGQGQRYPDRFAFNLRRSYPELVMATTLHMFAGSVTGTNATTPGRVWDTALPGVTTDVRPEACPDVVADYQALPFPAGTFTGVVADPPYADHWAGEWHVLPRPKRILLEAARVTKPGGLVAILHLIVIPAYRVAGVERVAIHPILAGPNNAVRVLNVFRTAP